MQIPTFLSDSDVGTTGKAKPSGDNLACKTQCVNASRRRGGGGRGGRLQ